MEKLDDTTVISIFIQLPPLQLFRTISQVCKKFHSICSDGSSLWSVIQDEEYQLEYSKEKRTYQNCEAYVKEVLKMERVWYQLVQFTDKAEKTNLPEGEYDRLLQKLESINVDYYATNNSHLVLPLQYRIFLRITRGDRFKWRRFQVKSVDKIISWVSKGSRKIENGMLFVSILGKQYSFYMCIDPQSPHYGKIREIACRYNIDDVRFNCWTDWLTHVLEQQKKGNVK